jgi:hypothetical protein
MDSEVWKFLSAYDICTDAQLSGYTDRTVLRYGHAFSGSDFHKHLMFQAVGFDLNAKPRQSISINRFFPISYVQGVFYHCPTQGSRMHHLIVLHNT